MNPGPSEELGETARSVVGVLRESPLSLALVLMNAALIAYLFYSGSSILEQRTAISKMIVDQQRELQPLLAGCVSQEVIKSILDNNQRITETMLTAEQREIQRMQLVIDREREFNRSLLPVLRGAPIPTAPDPAVSNPQSPPP